MRAPRRPLLPFTDLPRQDAATAKARRVAPRAASALPTAPDAQPDPQRDLLAWSPPRMVVPGAEVELVLLAPERFRPVSGETYLYHLTDSDAAARLAAGGLPLMDGLVFCDGVTAAARIAELEPDRDLMLVRVRHRLIHAWLVREGAGGGTCYVLVPNAGTDG